MAIPRSSGFDYHTVLHAVGDHAWAGRADDDASESLLGHRPSVTVTSGLVTLTRKARSGLVPAASFDGGEALDAVLQEGDVLSCWYTGTAEIGLSVTRAGSLLLALGALDDVSSAGITIELDPRVEEVELAEALHFIDGPGTRIVWLDAQHPCELDSRIRELDADSPGVTALAIVARTDNLETRLALNRRTMQRHRRRSMIFLQASERFVRVEDWLEYVRTLPHERPADLWLRIRSGNDEKLVPQGTTATIDGWLVHVLRVFERGIPGRLSQVGLVRADLGIPIASIERSTSAVASGLNLRKPAPRWSSSS
jgi:hypothetical protein